MWHSFPPATIRHPSANARTRLIIIHARFHNFFPIVFSPLRSTAPNSAKPLVYPVIEGAAPSPRGSRRQSCRPTAGGRNLNHMTQRYRRGPLGRGPLSLTATAILLREDRNRDSPLQFERCNDNPKRQLDFIHFRTHVALAVMHVTIHVSEFSMWPRSPQMKESTKPRII